MLIILLISLIAWSAACAPIMQEKTDVIIKDLVKLANELDERGLIKEADILDKIIDKAKGFAGEVKDWFSKEEPPAGIPDSPPAANEAHTELISKEPPPVKNVSKSTPAPPEKPVDLSSVSNKEFLGQLSVMPPGKAREDFLYKTISKNPEVKAQIAKQLKDQLVPVTVKGPHGTTITYNVTPDFLYVDTPSGRRRLQMTGATAEKIGKEFNMELPTDKMVDDIWEASSVKVRPPPLSASGVEIDGKRYSAQDVVSRSRGGVPIMMDPQALAEYNRKINEQLVDKDSSALVAGHLKTITKQRKGDDPKKLRLSGWKGEKGKALQPSQLTHHGVGHYYDYSHGTRYASNEVTVTLSDGTEEKTTMKELLDHPERYSAMAYKPGYTQYAYSEE
jgi:hypothetical protein